MRPGYGTFVATRRYGESGCYRENWRPVSNPESSWYSALLVSTSVTEASGGPCRNQSHNSLSDSPDPHANTSTSPFSRLFA